MSALTAEGSGRLGRFDPFTRFLGDLLLNPLKNAGVGGLIPKVPFKTQSGMEPTDPDMPIS